MARLVLSWIALVVGCAIFGAASVAEPADKDALKTEPAAKATSLFNGKDLTGWHVDVPHRTRTPTPKRRSSCATECW